MKKKIIYYEEYFFRGIMFVSTMFIMIILLTLIGSILIKGLPALSWDMISKTPQDGFYFGKEGGILNAIIGSVYLAAGSTLLGFAVSLPLALYLNVHLAGIRWLANTMRFLLDLLWGIPSIVYGAFGFTLMMYFGMRTSLLAGIITVTLFVIPVMVRSIDEVLKTVPRGLLEAALSLGSTKSETSYFVLARQCMPGIITAVLLSFGRAIGDAAAVLFTAGYTDYIPAKITDPAATLPLSVFFQLSSPIPEVQQRAYGSAIILTFIILGISILTRYSGYRYKKSIR